MIMRDVDSDKRLFNLKGTNNGAYTYTIICYSIDLYHLSLNHKLHNISCAGYRFFTFNARKELRMAITVTPTSANTAAHMLAIPTAHRIRTRIFTPIAK